MTGRWPRVLPLVALTALAAIGFYRLGQQRAGLTETDVIEAVAKRYVGEAGAGAARADCAARPSDDAGIWLVVTCTGPEGRFRYAVSPLGGISAPRVGPPGA